RFINSFSLKSDEKSEPKPVELVVPQVREGMGMGTGTGGGVGPGTPSTGPGRGDGMVPKPSATPVDAPIDYNKVFRAVEVTEKFRVLSKPNPQYTESARKYSVKGTVTLRVVLAASGEVKSIRVTKDLPHGLTQSAIDAAKQIKFVPATKD